MVDYKGIANAIPEPEMNSALSALTEDGRFMDDSTVQAAFNKIKDLEVTVSKGTSKESYISLSSSIGLAATAKLEIFIDNAITAKKLSSWVGKALTDSGINVNDPQVIGFLNSELEASNPDIDQDSIDLIISTGNMTTKVFPNLKAGHVQNAIQKRAEGVI